MEGALGHCIFDFISIIPRELRLLGTFPGGPRSRASHANINVQEWSIHDRDVDRLYLFCGVYELSRLFNLPVRIFHEVFTFILILSTDIKTIKVNRLSRPHFASFLWGSLEVRTHHPMCYKNLVGANEPTVLATFASGYLLDRIRGNYILIFGLGMGTLSNVLLAIPINPTTTYWAYGFPAMCLAGIGADTVYPCLGLFTTQALPRKDQSVAGAMFQTFAGLGRAMFLPITATIQTSVQTRMKNEGKDELTALLEAIRDVEWFCAACVGAALLMTLIGLRNIGKIGLLKKLGTVQSASKERDKEVA